MYKYLVLRFSHAFSIYKATDSPRLNIEYAGGMFFGPFRRPFRLVLPHITVMQLTSVTIQSGRMMRD